MLREGSFELEESATLHARLHLTPPAELAAYITEFTVMQGECSRMQLLLLPDNCTDLVFRAEAIRGGTRENCALAVAGIKKQARRKPLPQMQTAVVVRFRPGRAWPFFGVSMHELSDRIVPLDLLWDRDGPQLLERLAESAHPHVLVSRLAGILRQRLSRAADESHMDRRVRHAILLLSRPAPPRLARLAQDLEISERNLRRAFLERVGVSPGTFARVARFQHALRVFRTSSCNWADAAAETGYFDQAHLINEFRRLAGRTPQGLVSELDQQLLPMGSRFEV